MYGCKFPTTSVVIDDNATFANTVTGILLEHGIYARCIPNQAILPFLRQHMKFLSSFGQRFVYDDEENTRVFSLDHIHEIMYNPERFSLVTNMVIDFNMPGMTGKEVCEIIPDSLLIKKIIITGESWASSGLDMLDNGTVEVFLQKGGRTFSEELVRAVDFGVKHCRYFPKLTAEFIPDQRLRDFISSFISNIAPCEYYIFNKNGSYIFLSYEAKISGLMIFSDEEMSALYDFLKIEFPYIGTVEQVRMRQKMPVFFSQEIDLYRLVENLVDCSLIEGDLGNYYYAYTEDPNCFDTPMRRVRSYKDFVECKPQSFEYHY